MANIDQILNSKSIEVQGLLRKHKITGPLTIDTIRKGYDRKGSPFMMSLMKIITPTSNFTEEWDDPMGDALRATESEEAAQATTTVKASAGWPFWDNVLSVITKTGSAIGSLKSDLANPAGSKTSMVTPVIDTQRTNIIYWIGGGLVILIVIILLFKK